MKTAAIIAEYNPFHNGHACHIEQTRENFGATHIAVIMSGSFVQRGECACASKWVRAEMALRGGADIVIELPLPWAAARAEQFAQGGVSLANALGCVRLLSFGSESGDIELIKKTAETVSSPLLSAELSRALSNGTPFAAARADAAEQILPGAKTLLSRPNDTLAVEYCKALAMSGSEIEPVCVRRVGAGHDSAPSGTTAGASYLRGCMRNGTGYADFIPTQALEPLETAVEENHAPASLEYLDRAILYRLRQMDRDDIAELPDISEGLENRIFRCSREAENVAELCDMVKVKRYSHARIRRILLSALLGVKHEDSAGSPPYIRVLGMNDRGREILSAAAPTLPVITRYADTASLDERGRRIFALETKAADIFALAMPCPAPCGTDMTNGIIIMK